MVKIIGILFFSLSLLMAVEADERNQKSEQKKEKKSQAVKNISSMEKKVMKAQEIRVQNKSYPRGTIATH